MKLFASILVILFGINCFNLSAQENSESKKFVVKLINNCSYTYGETSRFYYYGIDLNTKTRNFDYGDLSVSAEFINTKFFANEFEVVIPQIRYSYESNVYSTNTQRAISGAAITTIYTAARYQMNHYFFEDKKVNPYFGLSTLLLYDFILTNPLTSNNYRYSNHLIGLRFAVSPGLKINFTEHLALNFDIPLNFLQLSVILKSNQNPAIAEEDRKTQEFKREFIPKYYSFRTGLIYSF